MRRYADVLVHRLLAGRAIPDLAEQVDHINHRARVVRSIQDLYERWKVTRHLATRLGAGDGGRVTVYITDVKMAGVLWFMPSLMLNGFCHVTMVRPSQYWQLAKDALTGSSAGANMIRLGGAYLAEIQSVNPVTCEVTLTIRADSPV